MVIIMTDLDIICKRQMGMKIIINRQEFAYNMVHQCERIELVGITNQQYWNHAQSKKIVPVK